MLEVHPRACGENWHLGNGNPPTDGPSPRVRGKRRCCTARTSRLRSIPARAGKTLFSGASMATKAVHPRACGENFGVNGNLAHISGPSPRVRGKRPRGQVQRRENQVHPRACGENRKKLVQRSGGRGPSPRVRGKRRPLPRRLLNHRSIPARAGKTRGSGFAATGSTVHPRACGENVVARHLWPIRHGPSPRVRGKQCGKPVRTYRNRSIPARAGKTFAAIKNAVDIYGPSPRVRGKRAGIVKKNETRRSIPARAGKTPPRSPSTPRAPVHPRACGENARPARHSADGCGPSPRVRGKHNARQGRDPHTRSIPARAGKTSAGASPAGRHSVHPRACGENNVISRADADALGPSPRVRGKPSSRTRPNVGRRSIPARAGKTVPPRSSTICAAVHPRACGENGTQPRPENVRAGPSPRVRGKRSSASAATRLGRSIPARAGKTPGSRLGRAWSAVHPRACGENYLVDILDKDEDGPSPRVRGKREAVMRLEGRVRSIPARAGKT